jgi:hypothetical protein
MPCGDLGHGRHQGQRLDLARPSMLPDALGDVLGIVADAFEHARNLERGDHFAQVVGHRRAQRDDAHGQPVDFGFERVDPRSLATTFARAFLVMADQRVDRVWIATSASPPISAIRPRSWLISFVEGLDGMFSHVVRPQP